MNYQNRILYLYFGERRKRTAVVIRWPLGCFQALDDASYCLDRPDFLSDEQIF